MDCSQPGSSVHGILQAGMLEWVAIPFSRGPSWPRDWAWVSCIAGRLFTVEPPGKPQRYPGKVPKGGRNVSNFLGLSDFPWGSLSSFPGLCFVGTQASVHFSPLLPLSRLHVPKDSRGMPHAELGCVFHSLHRRLLPREGTGWLLAHSPAQYQCLN